MRSQLAHVGRCGDEKRLVTKIFYLSGVILLVDAEALINDSVELGLLKWLGDVIYCSQTNGLHNFLRVIDT